MTLLKLLIGISQLAMAVETPLTQNQIAQRLEKYQNLVTLTASFKQTKTIKDINVVVRSEGIFTINRSQGITWKIIKPSPMTALMAQDKITIETGAGDEKETQVYKMSDLPSSKMASSMTGIMAWLNLDSRELFKLYNVWAQDSSQFKFVPRKSDSSPFKKLVLTLNKDGHVKKVNITENSLDSIELEFGLPKITYLKK